MKPRWIDATLFQNPIRSVAFQAAYRVSKRRLRLDYVERASTESNWEKCTDVADAGRSPRESENHAAHAMRFTEPRGNIWSSGAVEVPERTKLCDAPHCKRAVRSLLVLPQPFLSSLEIPPCFLYRFSDADKG